MGFGEEGTGSNTEGWDQRGGMGSGEEGWDQVRRDG